MSSLRISPQLETSWKKVLEDEFSKPYFEELVTFLKDEKKNKTIFPPGPEIFNAYNSTPFSEVKVVILGQDPYHGPGQAHGLSFSVKRGIHQPPSLQNIFKELESDLQFPIPQKSNGDLTSWARQGVLLLNAVLTVEQAKPNSHKDRGWENFTDATIKVVSDLKENVVFILWGNYAQKKRSLIDETKHRVIASVHPSPFSARNGFFGSKPFSQTNTYLQETQQKPVDWQIQ
jgi:uracil-DNA glycosylase